MLDIAEVPFIRQKWSKTTIQKIRASDDHTRIAFTVEMDETEKQTCGIRDMAAPNYYLPI